MSKRRPFLQFSLRALFAVFAVGTLVLAISSAYIRQGERQRYIIAEVQRLGGTIFYADERVFIGYDRNYVSEKDKSPLRKLLGEGYYRTIDFVDLSAAGDVPDKLFAALAALPELRGLQVAPNVSQHQGVSLVRKAHPDLEVHEEWHASDTFGNLISTPVAFEEAIAKEHCILFVDGDWSPFAAAARPILARFASSWTAKGERPRVSFTALDVSDPFDVAGVATITEQWMDSQSLPPVRSDARDRVGMVIWIEKGRAKQFRPNAHELSQDELFRLSREAFRAES